VHVDLDTLATALYVKIDDELKVSRVKNLAQDSLTEGWVFWISGWGFSDGCRCTSMGR
jgi:hypothetical protein